MEPVLGIDLGTTNSCVAVVKDGVPKLLPDRQGYSIIPSVVAITPTGKRLIGHAAKRQALTNPENTVYGVKRLIGRPFNSPVIQASLVSCPFSIVEGPSGDSRIRMYDKMYSLHEIQAMVLRELKRVAEVNLGQEVQKAVITVPAYFNDPQRRATKDAGKIAGLDVIRIINEPTSAALAYGFGKDYKKKVAVFDLGGGTFDISVLEINEGLFEVITSNGDTLLGGEDFDGRIIEWIVEEFFDESGIDLRQDSMSLQRLKDVAEEAKIELSSRQEVEVKLPFIATDKDGSPLHFSRTLSRDTFEQMVQDLVERTIVICERTLKEAGLKKGDLDAVLMVGGQTKMPLVQRKAHDYFEQQPSRDIHPDEAVAIGAAIQGVMLMDAKSSSAYLLDITPYSLGVQTAGGHYYEIIEKDTPIPVSRSRIFTTEYDYQEKAKIVILQGEERIALGKRRQAAAEGKGEPAEEQVQPTPPEAGAGRPGRPGRAVAADQTGEPPAPVRLGEFALENLKPGTRGDTKIKIYFDIDADGSVKITAKELATGNERGITLSASTYLDSREVAGLIEDNLDYLLEEEESDFLAKKREEIGRMVTSLKGVINKLDLDDPKGRNLCELLTKVVHSVEATMQAEDAEKLLRSEELLKKTLRSFNHG